MPAIISIIVSIDDKRGIGAQNKLLFKISKDLKRFKRLTMGHPIIMGRKTYQAIGRPLPGRTSIIITRDKDFQAPDCKVVHSLESALALAKSLDQKEIFIIGGGQIFEIALAQNLVDKLYITKVKGDYQAEIFFPDYANFKQVVFQKNDQEGKYHFTYLNLIK